MQVFDVVTNVLPIGLLGYGQVTISSVAGDTLYYSDSEELLPTLAQGSLAAGQSASFTETIYVVSASRTTVQLSWANAPAVGASNIKTGPGSGTWLDAGRLASVGGPTSGTVQLPVPVGPASEFYCTITGDTTFVAPNPSPADQTFAVRADQDSVGGHAISWASSPVVEFPAGPFVTNTAAYGVNKTHLRSDGMVWQEDVPTAGAPSADQQDQVRAGLANWMLRDVQAASATNVASLSGLAAVDGYTPVAGDRLLLTAQTTTTQVGVWVAQTGVWLRPSDYFQGMTFHSRGVWVNGGSTQSGLWVAASTTVLTVDTSSPTWVKKI